MPLSTPQMESLRQGQQPPPVPPKEPEYTGPYLAEVKKYHTCPLLLVPSLRLKGFVRAVSIYLGITLVTISQILLIGSLIMVEIGLYRKFYTLSFADRLFFCFFSLLSLAVTVFMFAWFVEIRRALRRLDNPGLWNRDLPTACALRQAVREYREHLKLYKHYKEQLASYEADLSRYEISKQEYEISKQEEFEMMLEANARTILGPAFPKQWSSTETRWRILALLWIEQTQAPEKLSDYQKSFDSLEGILNWWQTRKYPFVFTGTEVAPIKVFQRLFNNNSRKLLFWSPYLPSSGDEESDHFTYNYYVWRIGKTQFIAASEYASDWYGSSPGG
jgi:hypothetical protein